MWSCDNTNVYISLTTKCLFPYLLRSLALISEGFFLFSSANTTVNSRPRRIWPSMWCFASAASAGSTYWTNPKPLGSLYHNIQDHQIHYRHGLKTKHTSIRRKVGLLQISTNMNLTPNYHKSLSTFHRNQ